MSVAESLSEKVLVLDFGSQYSHLIVRRCRECSVFSELLRGNSDLAVIKAFKPAVVVLSGGPSSVYEEGAPHLSDGVLEYFVDSGIPLLCICYGMQEVAQKLGGAVEPASGSREYGQTSLRFQLKDEEIDLLFEGIKSDSSNAEFGETQVWMSHGDKVTSLPTGFKTIAWSDGCPLAAISSPEKKIWCLQFHPEVFHTKQGLAMIRNFLHIAAGLSPTWSVEKYLEVEVEKLKEIVGDRIVIGAVSGGVDSSVASALMYKAVGSKFHPFLIDTGLLRLNEAVSVVSRLDRAIPGLKMKVIDASARFMSSLKGVTDPESKRKIIGRLFIEEFEKAAAEIRSEVLPAATDFSNFILLQGTLYPDVIESLSFKGPSQTIKSHHNVGGLPEKMNLKIVEPLRELFKDEVRQLGTTLGLDRHTVWRHPFPGPGLGIRIVGEILPERVQLLQQVDSIYMEELRRSGDYWKVGQAFAVLLVDAKSVGVMGDKRTYEMTAVLRCVETTDYMTAEVSELPYQLLKRCATRIVNEVSGVNRVVYDVTSKPPGTIEWE